MVMIMTSVRATKDIVMVIQLNFCVPAQTLPIGSLWALINRCLGPVCKISKSDVGGGVWDANIYYIRETKRK